jgi:hypothetical protein
MSRRCAPRSMQPGNGRAPPPRLPRPARLVGSAEAVLHPRLAPQRSARPMCRGCSFGSTQIVAADGGRAICDDLTDVPPQPLPSHSGLRLLWSVYFRDWAATSAPGLGSPQPT